MRSSNVIPFPPVSGRPAPRAFDQVAVTHAGETTVYPSPEALRDAVLAANAVRSAAAPPDASLARTLGVVRALAGVALVIGALAGFAAFGLAELSRAGVL